MIYDHKTVAILGLGITGRSALHFFKDRPVSLYVSDDHEPIVDATMPPPIPQDLDDFMPRCDYLLCSPGISDQHPIVQKAHEYHVPILTDIEIFLNTVNPKATVIGITGSYGKSTTSALLAHILTWNHRSCSLGGNIGIPVLDLLKQEQEIYILELSSYMLDRMNTAQLSYAIITNIHPNHLNRYPDYASYYQSKTTILSFLKQEGTAIINAEIQIPNPSNKINLTRFSTASHTKNDIQFSFMHHSIKEKDHAPQTFHPPFSLSGQHNQENTIAAYACARYLGLSPSEILNALEHYKGLEHRQEIVDTDGYLCINDSKATSFKAASQALQRFTPTLWILGVITKKNDPIDCIQPFLGSLHALFLFGGSEAEPLRNQLLDLSLPYEKIKIYSSLKEAVFQAIKYIETIPDGVILFSPACPSTHPFKNFEERGRCFKQSITHYESTRAIGEEKQGEVEYKS